MICINQIITLRITVKRAITIRICIKMKFYMHFFRFKPGSGKLGKMVEFIIVNVWYRVSSHDCHSQATAASPSVSSGKTLTEYVKRS